MILSGKELAKEIQKNLNMPKNACLAIVSVGNDPASEIYIGMKIKMAEKVGAKSKVVKLPETITEEKLINEIEKLNNDDSVDGIIVQIPIPKHISVINTLSSIKSEKDVDGLHPENVGLLVTNEPRFIPATPKGIIALLKHYNIQMEGKHAVIVGRSQIVGKPMFNLLLNENATITMCHSKTIDLEKYTKQADILIVATGIPNLITKDMVKENSNIITVGIARVNGKAVGDCDFDSIKEIANITPVPGGVGPLTVIMLMENVALAARMKGKK